MARQNQKSHRVIFLDTTARDGKQSPGCNFGPDDTVRLAQQLVRMRVDVMEAGFPASQLADFEAVRRVATEVSGITCAALARARRDDIECAARAFENALSSPRMHIFVPSSEVHMRRKLKRGECDVIKMAVDAIRYAQQLGIEDIEFSPEDASRTGFDFLAHLVSAAIDAGAKTINIPDTVGYAVGTEFPNTIIKLMRVLGNKQNDVVISVHCHNDLGLATANTLAGLAAGARQAHCTVNGIGERAGNTHYAEVVMALETRSDYYRLATRINTREIGPTARLLASILGKPIPDTKPIIGSNVFAHSAGIHQDGIIKDRATYEIMTPEKIGWQGQSLPLTGQSGRHGVRQRLLEIGHTLDDDVFECMFTAFKELAATKSLIHNDDLHLLVQEAQAHQHTERTGMIRLQCVDYHKMRNIHSVLIKMAMGDKTFEASGTGNGPVDATWDAVRNALTREKMWPGVITLDYFEVGKGFGNTESLGIATMRITLEEKTGFGRGVDTDIIMACAKANVAALNHLFYTPIVLPTVASKPTTIEVPVS